MSEDTNANNSTTNDLKAMVAKLGGNTKRFGVLAASDTTQLTVIARNMDVAVGDLFLLPCERGHPRFYVFRATEYANVMNRTLDPDDIARNKLTMSDSFLAKDLQEQNLIQLKGIVLGYSEYKSSSDSWTFNRPRRLPEHLTDVYRVIPGDSSVAEVVRLLLGQQLGQDGLFIGNLLAGESALDGVPVQIPPFALSHHLAIFGRTGCGKSNMMMVFLRSIMEHNQSCSEGKRTDPRCSILAIDPHDEFYSWHAKTGGKDGIRGIVNGYSEEQKKDLVDPFYYLTAKDPETPGLEQRIKLSRADIHPQDVASVLDITDQQISFAERVFSEHGDRWITEVLCSTRTMTTSVWISTQAQLRQSNVGSVFYKEDLIEFLPITMPRQASLTIPPFPKSFVHWKKADFLSLIPRLCQRWSNLCSPPLWLAYFLHFVRHSEQQVLLPM